MNLTRHYLFEKNAYNFRQNWLFLLKQQYVPLKTFLELCTKSIKQPQTHNIKVHLIVTETAGYVKHTLHAQVMSPYYKHQSINVLNKSLLCPIFPKT